MKEATELFTISEFDSQTRLYTKDAFCHHIEMEINKNPELEYDIVVSNIENITSIEKCYGYDRCSKIISRIVDVITSAPLLALFYGRINDKLFAGFGIHSDERNILQSK